MSFITSGADLDERAVKLFVKAAIVSLRRNHVGVRSSTQLLTYRFAQYCHSLFRSLEHDPTKIDEKAGVIKPEERCFYIQLMVQSMTALIALEAMLKARDQKTIVEVFSADEAKLSKSGTLYRDMETICRRKGLPRAVDVYQHLREGHLPPEVPLRLRQAKSDLAMAADVPQIVRRLTAHIGEPDYWRSRLLHASVPQRRRPSARGVELGHQKATVQQAKTMTAS